MVFILDVGCTFAQVMGDWKIIMYQPEISGLSPAEVKEIREKYIGRSAVIGKKDIILGDKEIAGILQEKVDTIAIKPDDEIDSTYYFSRFFCQDISTYGVVRAWSMRIIDSGYAKHFMAVSRFFCKDDKEDPCVYVYLLTERKIAVCLQGDGVFVLSRNKEE